MGYIRHHAIIVTTYDEHIKKAFAKAKAIFGSRCSGIIPSPMNDYESIFIAPDGSKEGWADSDQGDVDRDEFVEWIEQQKYGDGSSPYKYVELFYGDDEGECKIMRHN